MQGPPPWNRRVRAEALRGYPLEEAARALGYRRDPHQPSRWRRPGSALSINRFMFYDHRVGDGGGGAIDLVAHARRCTRPEAVDFLAKLPRTVPPGRHPKPPRRERRWHDLRSRLVERRGLPDALVELCRDLGLIHPGHRGDALFVRRNAAGETVGAETLPDAPQRRRPEPPANAARGGFWMSWDPDWPTSVILAASALDALSILALDLLPARQKGAVAVSCTAAAATLPEWIQEWNPQRIFCAYNATPQGDRAAKRLIRNDNRIVRLRPPLEGADWNQTLLLDRAGEPLQTDDRSLD